jgi:hypothetical protein
LEVDLIPKSTVKAFWNAFTIEHPTKPTCNHSHIVYIQFLSKNIVSTVTRAVVLVKRLPVKLFISTRKLGLNLEKAMKWSRFTPPSSIKATLSELASDSNIVSDRKILSNQDIAHPAILSDTAILCNSAILSNPATLSDPAILCIFARLSNPATSSDPATFSNPSMLIDADDVMLTSRSQSKDVHNNNEVRSSRRADWGLV